MTDHQPGCFAHIVNAMPNRNLQDVIRLHLRRSELTAPCETCSENLHRIDNLVRRELAEDEQQAHLEHALRELTDPIARWIKRITERMARR